MEARDYKELKKMLCEELDDVKSSKNLGMAEIEIIDKLTNSIKNIEKIMDCEGEYSHGGDWNANGRYSRDDGMSDSYASRRGMHYVRGHYSRGNDRYSRYSYAEGKAHVAEQIRDMMEEPMSNADRQIMMDALEVLEK